MIEIFINTEKCTGCGDCIRVCPKGPRIYRLVLYGDRYVSKILDISFCIGCTNCVAACNPKAITLKRW